jgi:hypothetical protein
MFNAMSDAEIGHCEAELLPARTVLSMRAGGIHGILSGNNNGASGTPGHHGGSSQSHSFNLLWWLNHSSMPNSGTDHISGSEFGSSGANANGRPS